MKRVFIAITFIFISVAVCIYSVNATEKKCNRLMSRINSAIDLSNEITENDSHNKRLKLYTSTKNLNEAWENESKFFYFFFNNDDLKSIETNIEKIPVHAKNGDIESAYLCLVECSEEIEYLKSSIIPNFNNIF
jgi:hypothetical protein